MNIFKSDIAKSVFSNTFFQILGKVVSMSITVLATAIITRQYGPEGYGEFNLMQNFPALFFIILDFGFNAVATRDLTANWSKAQKYFSNIMSMRLLLSLLFIVISVVLVNVFPYHAALKFGIQLGLFVLITQALYASTNIIFQVKLRYDLSTIGYIAGSLIVLACVLFFSFNNFSVTWVNFSYIIGGFVTFFVNLYFVKRLGISFDFDLDLEIWKYFFIQSLPLGLMFVFSQINFRADAIMLSVLNLPAIFGYSNTRAVAEYGLGYKVFEVALVFPTFFMNALYPVLVRKTYEGPKVLLNVFLKSLGTLFACGLLFGLIGYVFAPFAINVLGGSAFVHSVTVLRILMIGLFVFFLTQPLSWLIVSLGKQKYLPVIYLISAIFNVIANFIVIPIFSFFGSAVVTILSEILILILLLCFVYRAWFLKFNAQK